MKPALQTILPILALVTFVPSLASDQWESAASAAGPDSSARLFVSQALSFRAAGLAGEDAAAQVLATLPGAGVVGGDGPLALLWQPFFANAVVQPGRLRSRAPVALYYNPLLDVALFTLWEWREEEYAVASVRAMPGERLAEPKAAAPPQPSWTGEQRWVDALARTTAARLDAFRYTHPEQSAEPGRDAVTFAGAAADLRAALPRIVWNAAQIARWAEDPPPWLEPALAAVDAALASRSPGALLAAAPDTGAEAAAALASLPPGFAKGLVLDMVIEAQDGGALLIGSRPEDGDLYVLATCRREGGECVLRRLVLAALLD